MFETNYSVVFVTKTEPTPREKQFLEDALRDAINRWKSEGALTPYDADLLIEDFAVYTDKEPK